MGTEVIEIPIFYGEDPERWVSWIDQFASAQGFSDFETLQFAYGFIEDEAHIWYCKELSQSEFRSWDDLKLRLLQRFGKSVEDVMKQEDPSIMDLCRCVIRWAAEDRAKEQQEQETLASKDTDQIVSHVGESLSNIDPIVKQVQRSTEKKKTEEDEIQAQLFASDVGRSLERIEKKLDQDQPIIAPEIIAPEVTIVAEEGDRSVKNLFHEDLSRKLNRNTRKKRKRWKKCLLQIWRFFVVNRRNGKKEKTSLRCGKEWSGFDNTEMKVTKQLDREKLREANRDKCAYHMFDRMHLRRRWVTKKSKRKKNTVTKLKRFNYAKEKVCIRNSQRKKPHKGVHRSKTPSSNGGNFHHLSTNYMFDRRLLLRIMQGKDKTKDYAKKDTQRGSNLHQWTHKRVSLKYIPDKKQLVSRKKCKFKKKRGCARTYSRCGEEQGTQGAFRQLLQLKEATILTRKKLAIEIKDGTYDESLKKPPRDQGEHDKRKVGYGTLKMCKYRPWKMGLPLHVLPVREVGKKCEVSKLVLEGAKLLRGHMTAMKKLVKWNRGKFRHKQNRPQNVKEMLSGNNMTCLWNFKLEHELFRKIFSQWCKEKSGCERAYLGGVEVSRLNGLALENWKSLGKLGIILKKQRVKYKCRNKTECAHMLIGVSLEEKKKEAWKKNTKESPLLKIVKVPHYHSTKRRDELTGLKDYMTMMKEENSDIYYATGERKKALDNSHFLEKRTKKSYNILYMVDPVVQLKKFQRKKLVSATKEGLQLEETYTEADKDQEQYGVIKGLLKAARRAYTEADMGPEHHGFDKAWQKGQEDSTLASDARLLLSLHHTLDCCSSYYVITIWTAFGSGKASWRTSVLSMTLRTRSVSMAPVMISVPKEERGPMDTSPRRMDH